MATLHLPGASTKRRVEPEKIDFFEAAEKSRVRFYAEGPAPAAPPAPTPKDIIEDPDKIYPGQKIRIPPK